MSKKYILFELKKYRGVIFHETEEGYKIWRGINLSFKNCHNEFDKFWPECSKVPKIFTLMGSLWAKCILFELKKCRGVIFHETEEGYKTWSGIDLLFQNWDKKFDNFWPEHLKVSKVSPLMGSFSAKYILLELKKYRGVIFHETERGYKTWSRIDLLFQNWHQKLDKFWPEHSKVSKVSTLIGSFSAKYMLFELKKYRGVIFHETEGGYKIWRGIDLSFENWHKEFGKFWPELSKVSKVFTLMGFLWAKYILFELKKYRGIIFHEDEEGYKIWRGIELLFQNWHKEFGKLWPERSKVSKIFILMGSFWAKYILFELKKCRGVIFHETEEGYKIWRGINLSFKNCHNEFDKFWPECSKVPKIFTLMGSLWAKCILFELKKCRGVIFHETEEGYKTWSGIDLLFQNWDKKFDNFWPEHLKVSKVSPLMGSFSAKYILLELKKYRGVIFHETERGYKTWSRIDLLFQNWHQKLDKFWPEHSKVSKVSTLIGSFSAKYMLFELKKYRGVIFHETEGGYKIWRGIDLSFENWHKEFGKFWPELSKVSKVFTLMGFLWAKYILFELKKYRGIIFHEDEEGYKIWRGIELLFQNWHKEFGKLWPERSKVSKIFILMGSFWAKYILFELKKCRGVIFHETEEGYKIWRGINLSFKNCHNEFDKFWPECSKVPKIFTLMGSLWAKCILFELKKCRGVIFHETEEGYKTWSGIDLLFQNWDKKFDNFWPEHLKVSKVSPLMGSFSAKYILLELKKYRGVIFHETERGYKTWSRIDLLFQNWHQKLDKFWPEHSKVSKVSTLIGSFSAKYMLFELKKYRGVIFHETEGGYKIWRGIDLSFENWHKEFGKFWPELSKVSKVFTLMGFLWAKYILFELKKYRGIIFHEDEEGYKIWRGIELLFQNWHKEFGKLWPERSKVSKIFILMGSFWAKYILFELKKCRGIIFHETEEGQKTWSGIDFSFQNWHQKFDWFWPEHLKVSKVSTLMGSFSAKYMLFELKKYRGVIFHETEGGYKIWRGIDLSFENWHKEFGKFWPELSKVSKVFTLMGFLWAKYILFELKKYRGIIFHEDEEGYKIWRGIELLFQNWHKEFGKLWPERSKVSKIFILMGSFWAKYILFELKKCRGIIFHETEEGQKTWSGIDFSFQNWHQKFDWFWPEHLKVSKVSTLMGSLSAKSILFELKKYRGVIFHEIEEGCKIWRGIDSSFKNWHK